MKKLNKLFIFKVSNIRIGVARNDLYPSGKKITLQIHLYIGALMIENYDF